MNIAVACDQRGFLLKSKVIEVTRNAGHEVVDLGTHSTASVDYPDYAKAAGRANQKGKSDWAVLLCENGVRACVAANKLKGIRAGLCHDIYSAHQGVEHDDMNVLALAAEFIGPTVAAELV